MEDHVKLFSSNWNSFNKFLFCSCSLPGIELKTGYKAEPHIQVFFTYVLHQEGLVCNRLPLSQNVYLLLSPWYECVFLKVCSWCTQSVILLSWLRMIYSNNVLCWLSFVLAYCVLQNLVWGSFTAQYLF